MPNQPNLYDYEHIDIQKKLSQTHQNHEIQK